jgi:hypothetical protein
MKGRWPLLVFGLLFRALTVGFAFSRKWELWVVIGTDHTLDTPGLFWWVTAHDERVDTRLQ